jgi:tetratricopeptide (TPR) repeat protein
MATELVADRASQRNSTLPALFLFLATVVVFSPVLRHRFIESWDDRTAILLNPDYNPPAFGKLIHYWTKPPAKNLFYVPVTYTLWGVVACAARASAPSGLPFNPAFFYAINLLAHAATAVVVYLILRELTQVRWAAWIGAALFALHPQQVEAVANAWSMYTPLSAALAFFAMWRYLRWSQKNQSSDPGDRSRAWRDQLLATVAFILALLSKPTVATVPLMLAAIELGLRGRRWREIILPLTPWVLAALIVTWLDQRIHATGRVYVPDLWLRPLVPLDAIAFYLGKLLVPAKLCMDYGRTPWAIAGRPAVKLTCLVAIGILAAAWGLRRRYRGASTTFGVFLAGLIPVIGIVPFTFQYYSTVADRYVYLAMLGPAMAVAIALKAIRPRPALLFALSSVLLLLAVLSVVQLRHWQDDWKLAAYTLRTNPRGAAAVGTFKYLLQDARRDGGPGAALPAPDRCSLNRAELIESGDGLAAQKFYTLAAACYRRALAVGPPQARLYSRLAAALARDPTTRAEAAEPCREALRLDPNDESARQTLRELARDGH